MSDMKSIGALWKNESSSGKSYLSGMIEIDGKVIRIVVFANGYKQADKHPDYKVYLQKPQGQDNGNVSSSSKNPKASEDDIDF